MEGRRDPDAEVKEIPSTATLRCAWTTNHGVASQLPVSQLRMCQTRAALCEGQNYFWLEEEIAGTSRNRALERLESSRERHDLQDRHHIELLLPRLSRGTDRVGRLRRSVYVHTCEQVFGVFSGPGLVALCQAHIKSTPSAVDGICEVYGAISTVHTSASSTSMLRIPRFAARAAAGPIWSAS